MNKIPAHSTQARAHFDEGELAFQDEIPQDDCPYPFDSTAGANWCAGWDSAENENATITDDNAHNDPRHGQAADLNRSR